MARIIEAFAQFFDGNGDPLIDGKLEFIESGTTSTPKATFSDIDETTANTNPVILSGEGRCPDVFGPGAYKVISYTFDDVQIQVFDPVGSPTLSGLASWESSVIYPANQVVIGSDGNYYQSISSSNQGNDPISSPTAWQQVEYLSVWNLNVEYSTNDVVVDSGLLYRSIQNTNTNNPPSSSPLFWVSTLSKQIEDNVKFSSLVELSKGADLVSASAMVIGTDGNYFDVTGTNAILSLDAVSVGTAIRLHFDDILTLTHDAVDLVLPGGADIVTASGDEAEFVEYEAGDWRCTKYERASGIAITKQAITDSVFDIIAPTAGTDFTTFTRVGDVGTSLSDNNTSYTDLNFGAYSGGLTVTCLVPGVITCSIDHAKFSGSGTFYVRVCKNLTAVQEWTTTSTSFTTRSVDVTVSVGDVITFQARAGNVSSFWTVKNAKITSNEPYFAVA